MEFTKVPGFSFFSSRPYIFLQMMFRSMIITGLSFWELANLFFEKECDSLSLQSFPHVLVLKLRRRSANPSCLILIFSEPGRLRTNLLSMQALSYITAISQPLHHTCSGLYWDSQNSCFILYTELTQRKICLWH